MKKRSLYILGLITLIVFPIPTFLVLWFIEGTMPGEIIQLETLSIYNVVMGLQFGVGYAFIALIVMRAKVFQKLPVRVEKIVKDMKLTLWDCLFLSICAGVGEELLFRSGLQFYVHPIIVSVIFVAIHGYLNPFNWRVSLYGLVVLPFILIISYGFIEFGLWFAISAHFAYDLILFTSMSDEEN
mgnify:CR=1 FL=1